MIKRIIFDIDLTLLDTLSDCKKTYKEYFKDDSKAMDFYNVIEKYDSQNLSYDKEELITFINDNLNLDLSINDFNDIFKIYRKYGTLIDGEVSYYLDKLSKRYELVALTKWYKDDQVARLESAGIYKYFKEVYAIENAGVKPEEKAFITACGDYDFCECLMVGDSIRSDMEPAKKLGIHTLFLGSSDLFTSIDNIGDVEKNIRYILFEKELNYIKDENIRNSAKILLSKLPDYFFEVAASATGKYHPKCDLGPQGLVRHSKNVVRVGYELLSLEMYDEEYTSHEKDLILYSLLFHDGFKYTYFI